MYSEQGVKELNQNTHSELLNFLDRMKIFKEKKIRPDIIEASVSSHLMMIFLNYKKNHCYE